jgi:hypothetical protein
MELEYRLSHELFHRRAELPASALVDVGDPALEVPDDHDVVHRVEEGPEIRLGGRDPVREELLRVGRRDDAGDCRSPG